MDELRSLPDDVISYICSWFLPTEDLLSCSLVSKRLYQISSSDIVWLRKLSSSDDGKLDETTEVDTEHLLSSSALLRARYALPKKLPLKVRFNDLIFLSSCTVVI
jgi:hypothetical protein